MAEFNPDGSIRLPQRLAKRTEEQEYRMRSGRCMRVSREIVSTQAPKKCVLHLKLSNAITDERFVQNIYGFFVQRAEVPSRFRKTGDREYEVEIGTCYKRCTDCLGLIGSYREFLDGNVIEDKGSCMFERREFFEEDYE